MKVKARAGWKALPLSHTFMSGGAEDAVCGGIEELTDYTLLSKGARSGKVRKKGVSAPPMKPDEERKRKGVEREDATPVKKAKLKEPSEKKENKKVIKKNTFKVVDVEEEEEKDFLKMSRSNVEEEKPGKKKKKKNKSAKNKPAINLDAMVGLVKKSSETGSPKKDVKNVAEEKTTKSEPKNKKTKKVKKAVSGDVKNSDADKKEEPAVDKEEEPEADTSEAPGGGVSSEASEAPVSSEASEAPVSSEWRALFLREELVTALEAKGFTSPTPIQRLTLPASLKGKMDIVGAAETGSGKTLAFGIPIIQGILEDREYEKKHGVEEEEEGEDAGLKSQEEMFEEKIEEEKLVEGEGIGCVAVVDDEVKRKRGDRLRALVVTPTRELAIQVHAHIAAAAAHSDVGVATVVGGMSVEKQLRLLARGPAIVVGTPGRLWDLVQEGNPHLTGLANIQYLAIDETDRMAEKGHFEELTKLLEQVNGGRKEGVRARRERQTFIMSATLSLVHRPPKHAKKQKQKSSEEKLGELMEVVGVRARRKVVDITRAAGTAETLSESAIQCALTEKDLYLYYFLTTHPGRTIVFCNSIDCVRRLTNLLGYLKISPLPIHAQLHQKQRLKNLDRFTSSPSGLLIATDVAARGLDIPDIQHVVHYQVPRTSEGYIHRSGRTARATRLGLSLLLVEPGEQRNLAKIHQTLARAGGGSIPAFPVEQARLAVVRDRVTAARRLDKMLLHNRKAAVAESWVTKAAEEADLVLSDEGDSEEEFYQGRQQGTGPRKSSKQEVLVARAALDSLLRAPVDQAVYGGAYPTMGGLLPGQVLAPKVVTAVDTLANDLNSTKSILKGGAKPARRKKFKKKKKETAS